MAVVAVVAVDEVDVEAVLDPLLVLPLPDVELLPDPPVLERDPPVIGIIGMQFLQRFLLLLLLLFFFFFFFPFVFFFFFLFFLLFLRLRLHLLHFFDFFPPVFVTVTRIRLFFWSWLDRLRWGGLNDFPSATRLPPLLLMPLLPLLRPPPDFVKKANGSANGFGSASASANATGSANASGSGLANASGSGSAFGAGIGSHAMS